MSSVKRHRSGKHKKRRKNRNVNPEKVVRNSSLPESAGTAEAVSARSAADTGTAKAASARSAADAGTAEAVSARSAADTGLPEMPDPSPVPKSENSGSRPGGFPFLPLVSIVGIAACLLVVVYFNGRMSGNLPGASLFSGLSNEQAQSAETGTEAVSAEGMTVQKASAVPDSDEEQENDSIEETDGKHTAGNTAKKSTAEQAASEEEIAADENADDDDYEVVEETIVYYEDENGVIHYEEPDGEEYYENSENEEYDEEPDEEEYDEEPEEEEYYEEPEEEEYYEEPEEEEYHEEPEREVREESRFYSGDSDDDFTDEKKQSD